MTAWKQYHVPASVDEALHLLTGYHGRARVVAGGTDLLLELRHGHRPPVEALIDITHIEELGQIAAMQDGSVIVGAGVTHTQVTKSTLLAQQATCLAESCGVIGGPQIRNVGTLGGNVAHALPAGDGTTALVALDASVEIIRGGRREWVNILEMFTGPGKSLLDSTHDLLLNFRFKLAGPGEGSAFKRIMRPQGVALPILGCAVWIQLTDTRLIKNARVVLAPVAPTPMRIKPVEESLQGASVDESNLEVVLDRAAEVARQAIKPRTSKYRATSSYRSEVAGTLLRQALQLAIRRAKTGEAVPEGIGLQ